MKKSVPSRMVEGRPSGTGQPYQSQVRRLKGTRSRRAKRSRTRRWRRRLGLLIALLTLIVVLLRQANGSGGAATADVLRSILGPAITARIEATYLSLADTINSVQYRLGGQSARAPWAIAPSATMGATPVDGAGTPTAGAGTPEVVAGAPTTAVVTRTATAGSPTAAPTVHPPTRAAAATPSPRSPTHAQPAHTTAPDRSNTSPQQVFVPSTLRNPSTPRKRITAPPTTLAPMPLPSLPVVITPALAGEGVWTTYNLPAAGPGAVPPAAKTYLRPDPSRPYALATILQIDLRVARLHIVAGLSEPGGPIGHAGPGTIPQSDTQGGRLLAVFNGGFKYSDGAYGLMSDGTIYVPPVRGAATIAVTRSGRVIMGTWGLDRRLTVGNHDLTAWRQNAGLLIDHGQIRPKTQDGSAWGLTILNSTYTSRSGIGLTSHGTLLYVAGNSLSAATLAQTLRAAGAVTAMQLDINPFWVRCFTYGRDAQGQLTDWALNPSMPGTGMEYLYGDVRDFFYLTRAG